MEATDDFIALSKCKKVIGTKENSKLKLTKSLKWYLAALVQFSKIPEGVRIFKSLNFHRKSRILLEAGAKIQRAQTFGQMGKFRRPR